MVFLNSCHKTIQTPFTFVNKKRESMKGLHEIAAVHKKKLPSVPDKYHSKVSSVAKHTPKPSFHSMPMHDDDDDDEDDDPDFDGSDDDDDDDEESDDYEDEDEEEDDENENASMDADSDDASSSGESELDRMVRSVPKSKDNIADDEAHDLDSGSDDDAYVDLLHRKISMGNHSFLSHYYMLLLTKMLKNPDDLLLQENHDIFSKSDRAEFREFKENNIRFGLAISQLIASLHAQFKTHKATALSSVMNKLQHATRVNIVALDDIVEQEPEWKTKPCFTTCNITNVKLMADKTKTAKNIMHVRGFLVRFIVEAEELRFVVSSEICTLMVAFLYIVNILKIMEADIVSRLADVPEDTSFTTALNDFVSYDPRETITVRYKYFIRQLSNIKARFSSLQIPELFQDDIENVHC